MTLEISTTFRGISTAKLSPAKAAGKAKANLAYITREDAARIAVSKLKDGRQEILTHSQHKARLDDVKKHLRKEITERAEQGGKNGRRVAEKLMFSLPNSWDARTTLQGVQAVMNVIAPDGSSVEALAAVHTDKADNRHVHILALDGEESLESAKARRPDAKRIRRQNVIRLSEKGPERPKELRRLIAQALNEVAERNGAEGIEWRSFEDRGITDREPGKHRGPEKPRLQAHHKAAVAAAEAAEQAKAARRKKAASEAAKRLTASPAKVKTPRSRTPDIER